MVMMSYDAGYDKLGQGAPAPVAPTAPAPGASPTGQVQTGAPIQDNPAFRALPREWQRKVEAGMPLEQATSAWQGQAPTSGGATSSEQPLPPPKQPQAPVGPPGQTTMPTSPEPQGAGGLLVTPGEGGEAQLAQLQDPSTFARMGSKEFQGRGFQGAHFSPESVFRLGNRAEFQKGMSMKDLISQSVGGVGRPNVSDVAGSLGSGERARMGMLPSMGPAVDGGLGEGAIGTEGAGTEGGEMQNQTAMMLQMLASQMGLA